MRWILNSGRKNNTTNENKMLSLNRGFVGFGTPEEKREEKKSYTTIKQYENFKKKAKSGDEINLYANKIGIIAVGIYTGESYSPQFLDELAPDWCINEKQIHLGIKWKILDKPKKYKPKPITLYEMS